ncbi:MAG: hypothetical protein K0S48_3795, partial [Ramlibacter sp.]|nr:hypothetical protein [Ramlibacter sp.]
MPSRDLARCTSMPRYIRSKAEGATFFFTL